MEQFPVFRFGDFVLDGSQRRLLRSGEDVYLPPKTFELLLHLLQNRGRVLTKDELLEAVWPDVNVVENTLAQRIREIREALGDGAHGGRFIKTVPRVGYQFIAELDDDGWCRGAAAGHREHRSGGGRRSRERASVPHPAGRDRVRDVGRADRCRVLLWDETTGVAG